MGYASLTGALIARKGQARPAEAKAFPHPMSHNTMAQPLATQPMKAQSQGDGKAFKPPKPTLEQQVRERFTPPYENQEVKKATVRLDKRLLDAVKIQATLQGTSQQDIFKKALEHYIALSAE